jgi:hypothetical protein
MERGGEYVGRDRIAPIQRTRMMPPDSFHSYQTDL